MDRIHFAANGSLIFNPVLFEDTTAYYCEGSNKVGNLIKSFLLLVSKQCTMSNTH